MCGAIVTSRSNMSRPPGNFSSQKTDSSSEIDLLLIGKSRNGKSSTGNSILGKNEFERNLQSYSKYVTRQTIIKKNKIYNGHTINVVDGLNIGERTSDDHGDVERDIKSLTDAIKHCNNGFTALLVVVKYGERFSDEEAETLDLLKSILGDHVLRDYGVCIITYGDNYQYAMKQGEISDFNSWCQEQPQGFQKLIKECNNRYVIFDNTTDSNKNEQFDKLWAIILKMSKKRYSQREFEVAKKRHADLIKNRKLQKLDSNSPCKSQIQNPLPKVSELAQSTPQRLSEPNECLNDIKSRYEAATNNYRSQLESFVDELDTVKERVNESQKYGYVLSDVDRIKQNVCQTIQQISAALSSSPNDSETKRMKLDDPAGSTWQGGPSTKPCKPISTAVRENPPPYGKPQVSRIDVSGRSQDGPGKATSNSPIFADAHTNQSTVDVTELSLLLIGLTGNGRSATGNSIVGKRAFKTTSSMARKFAGTADIQKESVKLENIDLHVIDGPGISNFATEKEGEFENLTKALEKSFELCGNKLSALLIVVKFGQRFTMQEARAMKLIKQVLGENIIKEHGICVVTHGDNFDNAVEQGEETNFEGWCEEQEGDIKDLFKDCNNKVVLFDNIATNEQKKKKQRSDLLDMIDKRKWYSRQ